jgi:large subunit ribosomal protein L4
MENVLLLDTSEKKKKAIGLIHRVYITQLKNSRKYTASTKTKSEVRGGGRKPWKQKGTGRARAGSSRSPLWVGGGVTFGPKPRTVVKKVNKKERQLAILSAFYLKQKQFLFFNETDYLKEFEKIKTKTTIQTITKLGIQPQTKILFVLSDNKIPFYKNFWLASRNVKNVEITTILSLNLKQILNANQIVLSENSLKTINLRYQKIYA